jgi:hypothetical protein
MVRADAEQHRRQLAQRIVTVEAERRRTQSDHT